MMKAACHLPLNLMLEVLDLGDELYEDRVFYDQAPNIEFIEYDEMFLYAQQLLRLYPDDFHQVFKTLINSSTYFADVSSAGKEAGELDEEIDTLSLGGDNIDDMNFKI